MTVLRDVLAVGVGKTTLRALRLVGRRGNALPGLVVEKLFPGYLARTFSALPEGVVLVTGTNGKTTTTKLIATILGSRLRVLTNDTGSNFTRGVITASVEHSSWRAELPYDVAVLELDEAWAVTFSEMLPPRRSLLLNIMRDQLDRFGEIDVTARMLMATAAATTDAVVLNRDDPRMVAIADQTAAKVSYFGVSPELRPRFPNDEELYGGPLFRSDAAADAELRALPDDEGQLTLRIDGVDERILLRAGGPHNAQNAAAAAAMALTFGLTPQVIADGLRAASPAFGRGQSFVVDGRPLVLQLVKNPAGFRQTLHTLDGTDPAAIVVVINDNDADGRDVSWLWDVTFTDELGGRRARLSTSGTRAADMAVRLRYDDIVVDDVSPDLERGVREAVAAVAPGEQVVVFSTYTAMWALHAILLRIGQPC
ncbi:MAG: MurT ligase domain-containing protein [Actinomycetota bacterium]